MKDPIHWFLAFLSLFILVIVALVLSPVPPEATGKAHEQFSTMLSSGESVASISSTRWLSYFFGLGVIGIFVFMLFMGARKKDSEKLGKIKRFALVGGFLYMLIYTCLVFSYWSYYDSGASNFILGFPAPTAWVFYGLGAIPLFFTFFYIWKFDEWIISPEELTQFKEIVDARRKRENNQ